MKRTTYLLKDEVGSVRARMQAPENEGVTLQPWMIHNINLRGWRVEAWETHESGTQIHGWADWQAVADNMATVLRAVLNDEVTWSEEEADAVLEAAQRALDDYHVAQMEVGMAREPESEESDDGAASD